MGSLVAILFVAAALVSAGVLAHHLAAVPELARRIGSDLARCSGTRDVRVTVYNLAVIPLGGNVVSGRFMADRRRPAPPVALPAAA